MSNPDHTGRDCAVGVLRGQYLLRACGGTKHLPHGEPEAVWCLPVVMSRTRPTSISLTGMAAKRGPMRRVPAPERFVADIETWLNAEYAPLIRSIRRELHPSGDARLLVSIHRAAPPVVIFALESGRVDVTAETIAAGPGYHRFVGRVLERLGPALAIAWPDAADDPEAATAFSDRATTEQTYLAWLNQELVDARARRRSTGGLQYLGTPAGVTYAVNGAIATGLGPRDDAWLDAAIADPRVAIEITPWWTDATDARYYLNQALTLMWLDVPWRQPVFDGEAELLDEVHRLLSRAYPLDPRLPYPWSAWAELVGLRGIDDTMARQAVERAEREETPLIGYKRLPVRISHAGWVLEDIPGSFAERRTDEEWWGGGPGRSITLAALDTGAMRAEAFLDQVAADLGPDVLHHRAGEVVGRGRLTSDASSGVEVGVLEGYSAVAGSGAVIRIVFDDPGDWQWALDTWKGLAPG